MTEYTFEIRLSGEEPWEQSAKRFDCEDDASYEMRRFVQMSAGWGFLFHHRLIAIDQEIVEARPVRQTVLMFPFLPKPL